MATMLEKPGETLHPAAKKDLKKIDPDLPVYDLVQNDPPLKELLISLGFKKLSDSLALNTVGRTVTLKLGAKILGLNYDEILEKLAQAGYTTDDSVNKIKDYLIRLNKGENLEDVRKDFVKDFASVSADEIMAAEQELMNEGTPQQEVQKLCDLHSSLFHGKTLGQIHTEGSQESPWLVKVLKKENKALLSKLTELKTILSQENPDPKAIQTILQSLKDLKKHYQKKWELIMPFLEEVGITGPSRVMWGVDDEILKDLSALSRTYALNPDPDRLNKLIARMEEMVSKEEEILFPLSVSNLPSSAWLEGYGDTDQIGYAWIEKPEVWEEGEAYVKEHEWKPEEIEVELPTGKMTLQQLAALFDVLPIDLTYIDENDNQIFFTNEGQIFSRPKSALGRKVYSCHPPQVIPIVEKMLDDFKAGTRNRVERWIPNPEKPVKVVYQAIYGKDGKYKGTLEMVQSFENEKDKIAALVSKAKS